MSGKPPEPSAATPPVRGTPGPGTPALTPPDRSDPFPREPFTAMVRRMPAYARLALALGRDGTISRKRRVAVVAAGAYLVSPVDLVPGFIPVVGQLDDLAVALVALLLALSGLPPDRRREQLAAAGLSDGDLEADLRTTGATAAWLARTGVRIGRRAASGALRGGLAAGRGVTRAIRRQRGTAPA
jgi:uncharacterized membrane protein YkvA (DUF1232 family)